MTKKTVLAIVLLISLTGCQNDKESQAEHDAKIAAQAKAELRAELKAEQEAEAKRKQSQSEQDSRLGHMGISTENGNLIIDTNKTKTFFHQMATKMKTHADKFAQDMEKGIIDNKDAGIEVNQSHIDINLDKTKSFLENWEKILGGYAQEFNKITQKFSNDIKKDINATD